MWYLTPKPKAPLAGRYNIRLLFYMPTRRKVDKTNLESAIMDVLVDAKILADDNRNIVAATDGTRVYYDKENPRTEIYIEDFTEDYDTWGKGLT
nr:MAG TPA: Endodeoxyribonuclease RusA [Siphoviridae sp. cthRu26]